MPDQKTAKVNGQTGAILTEQMLQFSETGANELTNTYEGSAADILQYAANFLGGYYTGTFTHLAHPNAKLEVKFVGAFLDQIEVPNAVWEYFATESQINLLAADIPLINAISQANIAQIQSYLQDSPTAQPTSAAGFANYPSQDATNAFIAFSLMLQGVDKWDVSVPTLRRSVIVSGGWATQAALTNVGKVISTPSLITLEGVPVTAGNVFQNNGYNNSTALFTLPTGQTSNKVLPGSTNNPNFGYGWLKKYPQIRSQGSNKWNIEQTWVYGLYSTDQYNIPL